MKTPLLILYLMSIKLILIMIENKARISSLMTAFQYCPGGSI